MSDIFHGFELLLFKKFSTNPEVWYGLRKQIQSKLENTSSESDSEDTISISEIVQVHVYINLK
jgi:hypothetical protein